MVQFFKAADAAKNRGDYETANFLFAYLLQRHTTDALSIKIGIEYWEIETDPETGDEHGEGNPAIYLENGTEITNELIYSEDYHSLVFIYMGNDPLKPESYLCIPAPMLSTECLKYCFKWAKKEGGFMPRRNHERDIEPREALENEISLSNIGRLVGTFKVPAWIFEPTPDYE